MLDNGCLSGGDGFLWHFDWSDVPGATAYHLQVSGPATTLLAVDRIVASSFYDDDVQGYVTNRNRIGWRWRARAEVAGQWGEFTPYRPFDVEPLDTDCPL